MWGAATIRRFGTRRQHFRVSSHPVIEGYDPPEGWGWCFVDR
jgi:hypothetical protein